MINKVVSIVFSEYEKNLMAIFPLAMRGKGEKYKYKEYIHPNRNTASVLPDPRRYKPNGTSRCVENQTNTGNTLK